MQRSRGRKISDEYLAQVFDERAQRLAALEARMQTVEAAVIKMADHVENCEKLQIAAVSERRAMASEQTAIKREARLYAVMIFVAVVAAIFEGHLHFVMQ